MLDIRVANANELMHRLDGAIVARCQIMHAAVLISRATYIACSKDVLTFLATL